MLIPYGLEPASAATNEPTYSEEKCMYGEMNGMLWPNDADTAAGATATPRMCDGKNPLSNPVKTT